MTARARATEATTMALAAAASTSTPRKPARAVAPIAIAPVWVSDVTAPAVCGFRSPRAYREWVRRHRVPYRMDGRTMLVDVVDLRAALARVPLAGGAMDALDDDQADTDVEPDELVDAADVLAELGLAGDR